MPLSVCGALFWHGCVTLAELFSLISSYAQLPPIEVDFIMAIEKLLVGYVEETAGQFCDERMQYCEKIVSGCHFEQLSST